MSYVVFFPFVLAILMGWLFQYLIFSRSQELNRRNKKEVDELKNRIFNLEKQNIHRRTK